MILVSAERYLHSECHVCVFKKVLSCWTAIIQNGRYFDPAKQPAGSRFRENCAENVMLGVRTYIVHTIHF